MRPLYLPLSLLAFLLILSAAFLGKTVAQRSLWWPFNLLAHEDYHSHPGDLIPHDAAIQERLFRQPLVGVRKMSDDEGEKFLMEYWLFGEETGGRDKVLDHNRTEKREAGGSREMMEGYPDNLTNDSSLLRPSFPLHAGEGQGVLSLLLFGHALGVSRDLVSPLRKRSFQCPSGTLPCTSINRPNSCCGAGDTCQLVADTGLGDVGCCGKTQRCLGVLSPCEQGFKSCPDNPGGGCCIPGFSCVDEGCIFVSTTTVIVTLSTFSTSTSTSTPISTPTSTSMSTTSSISSAPSSMTASPPVRPTSKPTTTITSTTTISTPTGCPTGFYACSALYQGGCCRTGRNCDTTSCPSISSITIVNSNGATIVVPADVTPASGTAKGKCANGWTSCAANAGGGCCPKGFVCGETRCTGTATGAGGSAVTGTVGKIPPENQGMSKAAFDWKIFAWVSVGIYIFLG